MLKAQVATRPPAADTPKQDEIWTSAINQESNSEWRYLRGASRVRTTEMSISADQIDFNSDTDWVYARGHVRMEYYKTGDIINAEKAEFNLATDEGRFYGVTGTAPPKLMSNPFQLTTSNPFYFQAQWVERIKNRYILHHGFVTDCKLPKPWWVFEAPTFEIVPGDHAMARSALFRVKHIPILYLPYFRRPLGRNPRQSGFLTPSIGHTTLFGYVYGFGYYWAMSRSYDMTAEGQYFTQRGPALLYNFRGKPNEVSDFNFNLYSVKDSGLPTTQFSNGSCDHGYTPVNGRCPNTTEGGTQFELTGRTNIWGFTGKIDYNYLSSYLFRQAFSYSFATAISSEVYSIGYLERRFRHDLYTLGIVGERDQFFEAITYAPQTPQQVVLQKLPSIEFSGRDRDLVSGPLPVWFSFNSSAGLLTRSEPYSAASNGILSSGGMGRLDLEPRVATNFRIAGFSFTPSLTLGATAYSDRYSVNQTTYSFSCPQAQPNCSAPGLNIATTAAYGGGVLFRKDADFVLDFRIPTLERVYMPPGWLHLGQKVKHVIEAEGQYEYVTGVNQFQKTIRFDATDILANTNQLTLAITNRLLRKDKSGQVSEFFSWRVTQSRYFYPTFGGAVLAGTPGGPGYRNVVLEAEELTPFAFLYGPRGYSPVVSMLSVSPYSFISFNWRADYDPKRGKVVAQTYGINGRYKLFFGGVSDNALTANAIPSAPLLLPQANQMILSGGYGSTNRTGWNAAFVDDINRLNGNRLYDFVQLSYNTNCCGFSFQIRQFNLGIRNDNQYLFSFSVANLGTFGSLQRQGRIF